MATAPHHHVTTLESLEKSLTSQPTTNNKIAYPGSLVKCITCHGEEFQGEVLAYDTEKKVLLIKQASSSGKPELNNITMLNMDFVKTFQITKNNNQTPSQPLPSLDQKKLQRRYKEEVELKMLLAKAVLQGATREGVNLFLFMKKLFKETVWDGLQIVVMDQVVIKPPYTRDSCSSAELQQNDLSSNQCLNQVRNMVERFHRDDNTKSQPTTTT